MELMALSALLGVALLVLGGFAFRLRAEKLALAAREAELAKRPRSVEADELLRDLVKGGAILQVSVLNAEDLLLRSPR